MDWIVNALPGKTWEFFFPRLTFPPPCLCICPNTCLWADFNCSELEIDGVRHEGLISCNTTSMCIYPSWICDHSNDCWDNNDEKNCNYTGESIFLSVCVCVCVCSGKTSGFQKTQTNYTECFLWRQSDTVLCTFSYIIKTQQCANCYSCGLLGCQTGLATTSWDGHGLLIRVGQTHTEWTRAVGQCGVDSYRMDTGCWSGWGRLIQNGHGLLVRVGQTHTEWTRAVDQGGADSYRMDTGCWSGWSKWPRDGTSLIKVRGWS